MTVLTMATKRKKAAGARLKPPALLRAAVACDAFGEWFDLAAQRHSQAWASYHEDELRGRLESLDHVIHEALSAIPESAAQRVLSVIIGLRDELRDAADGQVCIGVFFADEVFRALELIKLYAREAGHKDPRLAARERSGTLKQSSRVSGKRITKQELKRPC